MGEENVTKSLRTILNSHFFFKYLEFYSTFLGSLSKQEKDPAVVKDLNLHSHLFSIRGVSFCAFLELMKYLFLECSGQVIRLLRQGEILENMRVCLFLNLSRSNFILFLLTHLFFRKDFVFRMTNCLTPVVWI